MAKTFDFVCPCHFGLESVLKFEIARIGGEEISVSDGRVSFRGDFSLLARANICLSTAERVMLRLGAFKAETFDELFDGTKALNFEDFIGADDAFPVDGHSLDSALKSVPACQSIIKKAAVERLSSKYKISRFEETGAVFRIRFSIMKDHAEIYLDTSGEGLHKRGYRRNANAAPIKETLAAGIIDLARVRGSGAVCDPFCGSGTFLIEAAYKAFNIAPGLKRSFAAENWRVIDAGIWEEERLSARGRIKKDIDFKAIGYDNDPEAVALTLNNCKKAGISPCVTVKTADISRFSGEPGMITVCNPPYGERMLEIKEAERLYSVMGKKFQANAASPCYIISPHDEFESFFGKRADKKRKLYNGMIKCSLFMYFK